MPALNLPAALAKRSWMEQGHQGQPGALQHPRHLLSPCQPCSGSRWTLSRSGAEPFPLEETFAGAAGHPKGGQNAGTGFDTPSAQEEIFGPPSTNSVSCSHWELPASPTIPEETNLPKQIDPRSDSMGQATSDIPRIICHPTCAASKPAEDPSPQNHVRVTPVCPHGGSAPACT